MVLSWKAACAAVLIAGASPGLAQTAEPQSVVTQSPASAPSQTPDRTTAAPSDNLTVTAKPRKHGLMRFLFGRNRRHGGFFANLFHPAKRWKTTAGHRQHCKRRFKSYNSRTNRYRGYSGVRHICVL